MPLAAPTRPTLVFPVVEIPRARRPSMPPPLPHAYPHAHAHAHSLVASDAGDGDDAGAGVPAERPSERPTLKTLPPVDEPSSGHSNTQVIELSASALDSDPGLDAKPSVIDLDASWTAVSRPKRRPSRAVLASAAFVLVVAAFASGTAAVVTEHVTGVSEGLSGPAPARRQAASQHTPIVLRGDDAEARAAAGTCAAVGAPRVLATRAHLASGLDVSAIEGGFGVGFAASADEAHGVRLDGAPLRVVERMRVRPGSGVRHVAVEGGRREAAEAIELRIDGDGARTVVPEGDAPAFRVVVAGGWVQAVTAGRGRTLWPVPGGAAPPGGRAVGVAGSATPLPDLRVASRGDGGAVVALKRPSMLWLGAVDGTLVADGPLVPLPRAGALLGMPSVAPRTGGGGGGGGVVAWAERPAGDREWLVMVASFGTADDGKPEAPVIRPIGAGMSPSIVLLPDGELLLAYAVGTAGAHRVMARRLGRDLAPRGEPLTVSPESLNAGQPAAAVASDGRALVAFFGAERGHPSSVLATPLVCAPRL